MRHPNVCFERVRVRVTRLVKICRFFFLEKEYLSNCLQNFQNKVCQPVANAGNSGTMQKKLKEKNVFTWGDGVSCH